MEAREETAQDFRIGNLIHFNNQHKEVGTITGLQTYLHSGTRISLNNRVDISYDISEIKPIQLTEDLMIKMGAKKYIDVIYFPLTNLKAELQFEMYPKETVVTIKSQFAELILDEIKSIHQIQNLVFALTNQELTIKQ